MRRRTKLRDMVRLFIYWCVRLQADVPLAIARVTPLDNGVHRLSFYLEAAFNLA